MSEDEVPMPFEAMTHDELDQEFARLQELARDQLTEAEERQSANRLQDFKARVRAAVENPDARPVPAVLRRLIAQWTERELIELGHLATEATCRRLFAEGGDLSADEAVARMQAGDPVIRDRVLRAMQQNAADA